MYSPLLSKIAYVNITRNLSTGPSRLAASHYDSLGITPKATQSEVKAAYYKMSKMYHPDINSNTDAPQKFRNVTAAYEVLGDVRLRRLYDKGAAINSKYQQESDDPRTGFYKSRVKYTQSRFTGRTPVYDFDEWTRAHYGEMLQRDILRKNRAAQMKYTKEENIRGERFENVATGIIVTTLIIAVLGKLSFEHDRDKLYGMDIKK